MNGLAWIHLKTLVTLPQTLFEDPVWVLRPKTIMGLNWDSTQIWREKGWHGKGREVGTGVERVGGLGEGKWDEPVPSWWGLVGPPEPAPAFRFSPPAPRNFSQMSSQLWKPLGFQKGPNFAGNWDLKGFNASKWTSLKTNMCARLCTSGSLRAGSDFGLCVFGTQKRNRRFIKISQDFWPTCCKI